MASGTGLPTRRWTPDSKRVALVVSGASDLGLGLLCRQSPGVEAATDHLFVPAHRHLRPRAFSVVDRSLPSQSATLPNHLDVSVALGRGGFSRVARHRG